MWWVGRAIGWGHGECAHKCAPHMLFWGKNVRRTLNSVHTMLIGILFLSKRDNTDKILPKRACGGERTCSDLCSRE